MELTRENLLKAIRLKPLVTNICSYCGYSCSYRYEGGQLGYDNGCSCMVNPEGWTPRTEESLDFYLKLEHGWQETLKQYLESTLE